MSASLFLDCLSGDRLDVSFRDNGTWIAVEVKPQRSPVADLIRGTFQCVKYKAILAAQLRYESFESGNHATQIMPNVILACGALLSDPLRALAEALGDAKLCAALNSFWPAAAPDTGRTFGQMTALPLMDEELGFHPKDPRVLAGGTSSKPGWDGEFGPFLSADQTKVNFTWIERSDYTSAAFHGRMSLGLLGRIETEEQLARMDAYRECADRIRGQTHMSQFRTLLVNAEKIADWSQRGNRFDPALAGAGYLYIFVDFQNSRADPADPRRRMADVKNLFACQVSKTMVGIQKNGGQPKVTQWLHP